MDLSEYKVENATHLLICRHCIGTHCRDYRMSAILLGTTKSKLLKIVVFGERNWKDKDHIKRIKYVKPHKLILKNP